VKIGGEGQIEERAAQALIGCLREVPFVSVELAPQIALPGANRPDALVWVQSPGAGRTIVAEVKASGQPAAARRAVEQLLRYTAALPGAYGVFVAPYITPQAGRICTEAGVGYVDLAGNCRIAFDNVYIRVEGNSNPYTERRELRSLYSPKAERVLRVLLCDPRRGWRLEDLAEEAGVSVGHASNVKRLLEGSEWIASGRRGLRLTHPEALLTDWAGNYRYDRSSARQFYTMDPPAEAESRLLLACDELNVRCALTGFSGAARLAPFVRYQRATAYVLERIDEVASGASVKEVATGGNVTLLTPYDEGVFYRVSSPSAERVVSPVQCYLDVRAVPARGEEAAEALLERAIRPTW